MVFQKAFLMILTKAADYKKEVTFYFSVKAVIITSIVFILIFSLAALRGFMTISRSKLINLLNAEKHEDKLLKTRYFTGIMAIVLITIAYFYSGKVFTKDFFISSSIVIFCIILGTFLLFSSFLSVVIKFMTNKKKILYKGTNIISISNIAYRIRYNYRTLASITIIVATTITSIGAAFSVQHMFNSIVKVAYPYSFSYVSSDTRVKEKVLDTIKNSKHKLLINMKTEYLLFDSEKNSNAPKSHPVIKHSDFIRIINSLKVNNKTAIMNSVSGMKEGTAIAVESSNDSGFQNNQSLNMNGLDIKIKNTISAPLLGARFQYNTIILTDKDYNKFKENCYKLQSPQEEEIFNGIIVSNQGDSLELSKKIAAIPELKDNFNSYVVYYNIFNEVIGVVKFAGIFLGVVFMLSTASIMYMKIISDAIGDKKKYEILMKIGIDESELYRAVSKQVGLSYTLPLIVGAVYAFMGIGVLQEFLNKYLEISLMYPFIISLAIYSFVYVCFYLLTTKKFVNLVKA